MGRLPMSVLALAAVLEGRFEYNIIDANVDRDGLKALRNIFRSNPLAKILAVSVMPGMQMLNAIRHCKIIREEFPSVKIVWGGYFPSMHTDSVVNSSYVDYVIRGQAERAFIELLSALESKSSLDDVHNLSFRRDGVILHTPSLPIYDPNERPLFPYHRVRMDDYALETFVGKRTMCHETSVGCPHKCNFCGVVDVFQSRWKAETVERTMEVLLHLKREYGMDSVEFHDSEFFASEKRVAALAELMADLRINWWAEGRIDTILKYDTETWKLMQRSGLKMIFFGAESGLDETLQLMDKGGVTVGQTRAVAARCKEYNVQSEFSFVMGANPTRTEEDIDATIALMYDLQHINPKSKMHPFIYTPVPFGTIFDKAVEGGLAYPKNLDEWATHEWTQYTLRRNPHTPWLTKRLYNRIINFRAVQQSYFPKTNDRSIASWKLIVLRWSSAWRYRLRFFPAAFELRLLLRLLVTGASRNEGF